MHWLSYFWKIIWKEAGKIIRTLYFGTMIVPGGIGLSLGLPMIEWVGLSVVATLVILLTQTINRAKALTEKMEPKLRVTNLGDRFDENSGFWVSFISVENISSTTVNGVSAKINSLYDKDGDLIDMPKMQFRLFREPYRNVVGYIQSTNFPLAARESEEIAIAETKLGDESFFLCFARKDTASKGLSSPLLISEAPYILEIFIHSNNAGEPIKALYLLRAEGDTPNQNIVLEELKNSDVKYVLRQTP
ncbi:MAG: hypothetical protein IIB64_10200 [Proteobacteria bacterium]|nr:hypothetical protein [Pseudomonadota bacterium]